MPIRTQREKPLRVGLQVESVHGAASDARRSRVTFLFMISLLVTFTLLFVRDSSSGPQGASILVVLYPEKLSIRRAALSGFGLVVASVGVVFF